MFVNRPNTEETEEDILNFQRNFLASGSQPAAKVIKKRKNDSQSSSDHERDIVRLEDDENIKVDHEIDKRAKLDPITNAMKANEKPAIEDMEEEMEKHDFHITAVLSKIKERDTFHIPVKFPSLRTNAFPSVFHRANKNSSTLTSEKPKKSIFAQQFRKKSLKDFGMPNVEEMPQSSVEPCMLTPLPETISLNRLEKLYPEPSVISGQGLSDSSKTESQKIHQENLQRLATMSEHEVLAEKIKLSRELDPKLISFLQNRKKVKPVMKEEMFLQDLAKQTLSEAKCEEEKPIEHMATDSPEQPTDQVDELSMNKKYTHMDVVEAEKLAWMEMIPKKQRIQMKISCRFDFEGSIIENNVDVPTHIGLHHHGDEPDQAGYTLQELFILARSNFTQQRVFAVTLLGKIMAKAKHGYYVDKVKEPVLENLLNTGILFLLRWSLDEQSETLLQASVFALHALLCSSETRACHDAVFLTNRGCEIPKLSPDVISKNDDNDYEIAQKDVINGLIKMKILSRIRYILEVCLPSPVTVNHCLDILMRISLHSINSSVAVYECPRLIQFIVQNLIPISSEARNRGDQNSTNKPFAKAVRLLRTLCSTGRHLTSRLLNDFSEIKTIIFRFVGSHDVLLKNTTAAHFEMEFEVWKLWIQCGSYSFLCDIFSDLFQIIVRHIQSFTTILSLENTTENLDINARRSQLIIKLCNIVMMSSNSHNMTQWKELSEQFELIGMTIVLSNKNSSELHSVLSTVIDFLASYCRQLSKDSDVLVSSSYSEKLCINFLLTVFQHLKSISFPKHIDLCKREIVSSLPELHLPSDQKYMEIFQLLSSYLECCVAVCNLNKSCCASFRPVLSYMAENFDWMLTEDEGNSTFFMRCRTYCLYWVASLYTLIVTNSSQTFNHCGLFYYTLAFRCFNQLSVGDEHRMHHLLSTVLFHTDVVRNVVNSASSVTKSLSTLNVTKNISEIVPDFSQVFTAAISGLALIRSTHMSCLYIHPKILEESKARFFHKSDKVLSFLLKSGADDACLPSDWPFIPVLQLYDQSINRGETTGGDLAHISNCLHYLCILEAHCSDCLFNVTVTAKIVRLMCVFLAGNDIFLESPVKECLAFLFSRYCNVESKENLDFSLPIPGISSFYDFYMSLLEQYQGVSYGDDLFSAVILLPMHQLTNGISDIKKALWCDRGDVLRILTLPISKLLIPVSWYLYPVQNDVFMIRAYVSALARGYCSKNRNPVPYLIAIHHTAQFLFNKESNVALESRREIYMGVLKLKQGEIRKHVLHYVSTDDNGNSKTGFLFSEKMFEDRMKEIKILSA